MYVTTSKTFIPRATLLHFSSFIVLYIYINFYVLIFPSFPFLFTLFYFLILLMHKCIQFTFIRLFTDIHVDRQTNQQECPSATSFFSIIGVPYLSGLPHRFYHLFGNFTFANISRLPL